MPLSLAPTVGTFVAAALTEDGLLAVVLAHGVRGSQHLTVLDAADGYAPLASVPVPHETESGVTQVIAAAGLLITADDRTIGAYRPRTGERVWQRRFHDRVWLKDAAGDRILVATLDGHAFRAAFLRVADGADDGPVDVGLWHGMGSVALAPSGLVAAACFQIEVTPLGGPRRALGEDASRSVIDDVAIAPDGRTVLAGRRDGEWLLGGVESGAVRTIAKLPTGIRTVGFEGGRAWALDADGALHFDDGRTIDLKTSTYGGIMAPDGATFGLSDLERGRFVVRSLPDGAVRFATSPGFAPKAIAITAAGGLVIAGPHRTALLGETVTTLTKRSASALHRLPDGSLLLESDAPVRLPLDGTKAVPLGRSVEWMALSPDRRLAAFTAVSTVRVVDLATGRVTRETTLDDATDEVVDAAFFAPNGDVLVQDGSGRLWRWLDDDIGPDLVAEVPARRVIVPDPTGATLAWSDGRQIERLRLDDGARLAPILSPASANVGTLIWDDAGGRLAAFHADGTIVVFDLAAGRTVTLARRYVTTGVPRDPNALYVTDFAVARSCAWSRDGARIAVVADGGVVFCSLADGAEVGRVFVTTDAKGWAVGVGDRVDGSGKTFARDFVVDGATRARGLLATLT